MEDPKHNDEAVLLPKTKSKGKGVANVESSPSTPNVVVTTKAIPVQPKWKKGIAILDFILRLCAAAAALAATSIMGTTEQTLPFFTQFLQFHAEYNDLPTFTFFVIANAAAGGYLVLSLPFSITSIVRPHALGPRFFLVILDTVMVTLTISAASAAAAIVYLAHNGNSDANWIAICQQFNDFCQQGSAAVVASFIAAVFFILLVVNSAVALKKTYY